MSQLRQQITAVGSRGLAGAKWPVGHGWLAIGLFGLLTLSCISAGKRSLPMVCQPESADEFRQLVREARRPVLVAFTSESCVTCRTMRPSLSSLAADYAGRLVVVEADLGKTGALIADYNLLKLPTVIVLRNGQEVARRHGLLPAPFMASFIDDALATRR